MKAGIHASIAVVVVCASTCFLLPVRGQDESKLLMDQLQQKLATALNNKTADFDIDRKRRNDLGIIGGNSFDGHGTSQVATINGRVEGTGLNAKFIFTCDIPWKGDWRNKSWIPINQYRSEDKDRHGHQKQVYKVHLIGGKIEIIESRTTEANGAMDHDSVVMPVDALKKNYFNNQEYLRKALFD